eukprot:TRINITY_DN11848_c0_g1_i1.p1 TRINITY_DN11848_c0_g1~~TRINITY_DN11848_c0_g1_i1.p1  ORF type:complete len:450 (-),score=85.64 TRINITY_DN11848_c0_g1_i1:330-1679(-)
MSKSSSEELTQSPQQQQKVCGVRIRDRLRLNSKYLNSIAFGKSIRWRRNASIDTGSTTAEPSRAESYTRFDSLLSITKTETTNDLGVLFDKKTSGGMNEEEKIVLDPENDWLDKDQQQNNGDNKDHASFNSKLKDALVQTQQQQQQRANSVEVELSQNTNTTYNNTMKPSGLGSGTGTPKESQIKGESNTQDRTSSTSVTKKEMPRYNHDERFTLFRSSDRIEVFRKSFTGFCGRSPGIEESVFIRIMAELSNLHEYEILDLFDMIDCQQAGYISCDSFWLFIALLLAYDCFETVNFLQYFGESLFLTLHGSFTKVIESKCVMDEKNKKTLSSSTASSSSKSSGSQCCSTCSTNASASTLKSCSSLVVSVDRLKSFGRILGMSEAQLVRCFERFERSVFDSISYETFFLLASDLCAEFDQWRIGQAFTIQNYTALEQCGCECDPSCTIL